MKNRLIVTSITLVCLLLFSAFAVAQNPCLPAGQRNLTDFIEQRICENLKARVAQTDPTKQSAPPASTTNSTSLVERSSAPDLLGFGLDFLNLSDNSGEKKSATPKTISFSAYALKSLLSNEDPLDPEIYNRNQQWRKLSFTVGYEVPENTNGRDPTVGVKWLIYNGRDVSTVDNQSELQKIQTALDASAIGFSAIRGDVRLYIFALLKKRPSAQMPTGVAFTDLADFDTNVVSDTTKFESIISSLTDAEKKNIDSIVSKYISVFVNLDTVSKNVVTTIRTKPQLGLAISTTQRRGGRPDEYSGALTFDKGIGTSSITINGSFVYKNNVSGKDFRGGKFAAAIHLPLQGFKPLAYSDPLMFSLEANATGMTGIAPIYNAQAKLTIPFPKLPGVEIPLSVSVA